LLGGLKRALRAPCRRNYRPHFTFQCAPTGCSLRREKKAKLTRAPGLFSALALLTVQRIPRESYLSAQCNTGNPAENAPGAGRTTMPSARPDPPQTTQVTSGFTRTPLCYFASAQIALLYRPNRKEKKAAAFLRVRFSEQPRQLRHIGGLYVPLSLPIMPAGFRGYT
jgi:hypothetical protein